MIHPLRTNVNTRRQERKSLTKKLLKFHIIHLVFYCFVLAFFTEKLTFTFRNVNHMSFKFCKGNTKGRRRGG